MTAQSAEILDADYARDRAFMVERHLKARGICDPLLLVTMGAVPRETFVAEHLQEFAYEDSALPIEAGQTIFLPDQRHIEPSSFEPRVREEEAAAAVAKANVDLQKAGIGRAEANLHKAQPRPREGARVVA